MEMTIRLSISLSSSVENALSRMSMMNLVGLITSSNMSIITRMTYFRVSSRCQAAGPDSSCRQFRLVSPDNVKWRQEEQLQGPPG